MMVWFLDLVNPHASVEGPARRESKPVELHQDAAALLLLLSPLLQAAHRHQQRQ
jgi:hypothetical protein